jgi:hypothetical protein
MQAPTKGTGFHGKIGTFQFRGKQFRNSMQAACRKAIREAAKAWLIEVIRRIPVRTGFLVGAFGNLEDALNVSIPTQASPRLFGNGKGTTKFSTLLRNSTNARLRVLADISRYERKIRAISEQHYAMEQALRQHKERTFNAQDPIAARAYAEQLRKAEHRVEVYNRAATRMRAKYQKLLAYQNKLNNRSKANINKKKGIVTEYARGAHEVASELADLREKMHELGGFPKEYNPRVGRTKVLRRREYVERTHEIDDPNADYTKIKDLKERIKAKQRKAQKIRVTEIKERMKLFSGGKNIYGHSEYYKHYDGRKVLKTPKSARQFATPEEKIFPEYNPDDVIARLQAQQEATTRALSGESNSNIGMSQADMIQRFNDATADNYMKELKRSNTSFSFQYVVNVRYYSYNDMFRTSKAKKGIQSVFDLAATKMPWMSQIAGAQAFKRYMETEAARRIPNVFEFFLTRTQKFDGSDSTKSLTVIQG